MARDISVYRSEAIEAQPSGDWRVRDGAESLYDQPFGSESAVREFWSEPAALLALPLLASVYDYGFYHGIRWGGSQLRQVLDELTVLEAFWASGSLPPPADGVADPVERASYLRLAVAVAEDCGGFVVIT